MPDSVSRVAESMWHRGAGALAGSCAAAPAAGLIVLILLFYGSVTLPISLSLIAAASQPPRYRHRVWLSPPQATPSSSVPSAAKAATDQSSPSSPHPHG